MAVADVIVCTCLAVGEREIRGAIAQGARTLDDVSRACEAGTGCQTCHPGIEAILASARPRRARSKAPNNQLGLFDADP